MRPSPFPVRQPAGPDAGPGGATLAVGVLEDGGGLAGLLAGIAGVSARPARTLDELVALVETGMADAAVVDPDRPDGWPADVAEAAAERLAGRVPLVLVCRSGPDAPVVEARVAGRGATVLLRERLSGADLAAVLAGELARRRAGPGWAGGACPAGPP